ncbi:MAG: hypothetical protein CVV27_09380 [Candidatus Melainabacteria bacterium HGW-Melainabacteria-1]|nr:MAG: hypothetical protein CVV27_09380 [Candidatus Melainabacteria bacterium HGW-Melainabacteria-1]
MIDPSRPLRPLPSSPRPPAPVAAQPADGAAKLSQSPSPELLLSAATAKGQALPTLALNLAAEVQPSDWGDVTVAERQANLKQLQSLAHDLKARNTPGVELWSKLTQAAVAAYEGRQLAPGRKSDFVMQDLSIALVGGDALKHLQSYLKLPWVRRPDPMVNTFMRDWALMGVPPADQNWERVGWAGDKLDRHRCADFRPEINDGSENQIYHTLFYQFMAYTTQAPFTIHGGSLVHEIRDNGTSSEDHNAAFVGMSTGMAMRRMRDGAQPETSLREWPVITRAAYGKGGGPDLATSERARITDQGIRHLLGNKPLAWKAQNLLIDTVKEVKSWF